ncbi:hypothetical protein ACKC5O_07100 [Aeromonas schubertii]|uniref:Uncharacterized protein n=1 Tax=Aeromonas schubertii TaxID=652 RepID=A0ABS7VHQ7_9GAMM|nr:hypothetical protein [Aeromonas schubertii]MBZ6068493.1 hypothetical protein [Aeromonas schubertii]
MKALMINTLMSAGSILDIGSDTKRNIERVRHHLRTYSRVKRLPTARAYLANVQQSWYVDTLNLSNDWQIVGEDLKTAVHRLAVEVEFPKEVTAVGATSEEASPQHAE